MGVQTRLRAKRVKIDADDNIVVANPLHNPAIIPDPVFETIVASVEVETQSRPKRKRGYVTPMQPFKDGPKVLLRGMDHLRTPDTTPETTDPLSTSLDAPMYRTRGVTKRQSQTPFGAPNAEVEDVKMPETSIGPEPVQVTTPVDIPVYHTRNVKRRTKAQSPIIKGRAQNTNPEGVVENIIDASLDNTVQAKIPNNDKDEEHSTRNRRVTRSTSTKPDSETDEALQKGTGNIIVKSTKTTKVVATKAPTIDRDSPDYRIPVKRGSNNPLGLTSGFSPYPNREVPTLQACEDVYHILAAMHGKVEQPRKVPKASLERAGCGEVPCVLDALLRTLISGNTMMPMADQAIRNVVQEYGLRNYGSGAGSFNWDKVASEPVEKLAQTIKVSGNGNQKAKNIKSILDMVASEMAQMATTEKDGKGSNKRKVASSETLNLDHMHNLTKDKAMAKLVLYPGIGVKSAACVTLFCLQKPCFAVDTHVHRFCRWLGWVPEKASPEDCFRHCDVKVPDHLKYGLHKLFICHGQECFRCRKATRPGTKEWMRAPDCPLEHLLDRGKERL